MFLSHHSAIDIAGQRFGRLYALRAVGNNHLGVLWYCLCSCGNRKVASVAQLRAGGIKSCGCLKFETAQRMGKALGRKNALNSLKGITGFGVKRHVVLSEREVLGIMTTTEEWRAYAMIDRIQAQEEADYHAARTTGFTPTLGSTK